MKFLMTLLVLVLFQSPLMAGEPSRSDIARHEAHQLSGLLMTRDVSMDLNPLTTKECGQYDKTIFWEGKEITVLEAMDGLIKRLGSGPNVPEITESVIDRARRVAQDKNETMEEPVVHPYQLQQWRQHRARFLENCGTGHDGQSTNEDLEGAYWLYRAAHNPPAYLRVARTIMERMPRENDEQVRWICRQVDGRIDRQADICDTMDITGGLGTREAKR